MKIQLLRWNLPRIITFGLIVFYSAFFHMPIMEGREKDDRNEILVIGTGVVLKGNVAAARKEAISDALLKGIEEYLAEYLGSEGMINNFPRLINEVIPGMREEIENFYILAEESYDKQYNILVRIKISEKQMQEKLREMGIITMEGPPIKVLFMASEKDSREGVIAYWWKDPDSNPVLTKTELTLHRLFQERGFSPVDRSSSITVDKYSPDMRKMDLSDDAAMEWGRLFSSDVVILGKSEIVEDEMVLVNLKAINVEKNELIDQDLQIEQMNKKDKDADNTIVALERAINDIVNRLSPAIIRDLEERETEINKLEVELRGLRNFKQLRAFKNFLKEDIKGVKSVIESSIKGPYITVMVEFSGDEKTFLSKVEGHKRFPFISYFTETEKGEVIINIK